MRLLREGANAAGVKRMYHVWLAAAAKAVTAAEAVRLFVWAPLCMTALDVFPNSNRAGLPLDCHLPSAGYQVARGYQQQQRAVRTAYVAMHAVGAEGSSQLCCKRDGNMSPWPGKVVGCSVMGKSWQGKGRYRRIATIGLVAHALAA